MSESTFGLHSVQTLLKVNPDRILKLFVSANRQDQRLRKVLQLAEKLNISIEKVSNQVLDDLSKGGKHQGVFAETSAGANFGEAQLYELIESDPAKILILILDGVTDPHNLGACLRSADATGVTAVIVPKDNSAGLTEVAKKVACGAAETVPLVAVTNLARTLEKIKALGVWVTGTAGEAACDLFDADLSLPRAIVMGAEGKGMRRLTREHCDELVSIPMQGKVSSLNVSVATGVVLFEVLRQKQ
jgi:23S rRNA (guanosine2251-2'-O)-methyltransferase